MGIGLPQSDVFRPRLPLDPFDGVDLSEPWVLDPAALAVHALRLRRDVILALGAPKTEELLALLTAQTLSCSLLLVVTHEPPDIDFDAPFGPTVRVLRLGRALSTEDAGELCLVSVLEHAETIARQWRAQPNCIPAGMRRYAVLSADEDGEFSVVEEHADSPASSLYHGQAPHSVSAAPARRHSLLTALSDRTSIPRTKAKAFKEAACGRSFDVVVNYLSPALAEKLVLKQVTVITNVSQPFLNSPATAHRPPDDKGRHSPRHLTTILAEPGGMPAAHHSSAPPSPPVRRRTIFRSGSAGPIIDPHVFAPPTPAAHIIHVIHPGCAANRPSPIVQSVSQFLHSLSDRRCPVMSYLVSGGLLGYSPPGAELNVADIVLAGLLDRPESDDEDDVPVSAGFLRRYAQKYKLRPKAVIENLGDISVAGVDSENAHHQHYQDGMIFVYTKDGVRQYDCDPVARPAALANMLRRRASARPPLSEVSANAPVAAKSKRTTSRSQKTTPPLSTSATSVPFPSANPPSPIRSASPDDILSKKRKISKVGDKILRRSTISDHHPRVAKRPSLKHGKSLKRGQSLGSAHGLDVAEAQRADKKQRVHSGKGRKRADSLKIARKHADSKKRAPDWDAATKKRPDSWGQAKRGESRVGAAGGGATVQRSGSTRLRRKMMFWLA
ncbi:hypothetical protein FB107DRAFT_201974 [Schizophyllum commune]